MTALEMAPIPSLADAPPTTLHLLSRRDAEQGRIAGLLVGCLIGGVIAAGIVYYCFNCVFGKEPRRKDAQPGHVHEPHMHRHTHPRRHRHAAHAPQSVHVHTHAARAPHTHRWTHHHHRHAHHHHRKHQKSKPRHPTKTKRRTTRRARRPNRPRGTYVQFMPMPPMEMPLPPAPAVGMGMGLGVGVGMGMAPDDDFIDYGPAPENQDPMVEMGWGVDPGFRLERFAGEDESDGDKEASCNECCFAFWDALCGVETASRDLRRDVAGGGLVVLEEEEMAAD